MFKSQKGTIPVAILLVGAFAALTGLALKNNLISPSPSPSNQTAAASSLALPTPPTIPSYRYGVHLQLVSGANGLSQDQTELALAKQSGAGIVRIGVSWKLLEQYGKGSYMSWYTQELDTLLNQAQSQGTRVILMVGEVPCWASAQPDKVCNSQNDDLSSYNSWYYPTNNSDFDDALTYFVKRYSFKVYAWEVWNEPNIDQFWPSGPNAAQYTAMLKSAYTAIKKANPTATVLGGALSGADTDYLTAMYQAGAKGSFDDLSIHPYSNTSSPGDCSNPRWSFQCGISNIRQVMLRNFDLKNLWLTEFGWSSYTGEGGVGEATQAQYLQQACADLRFDSYVPVAIWYDLIDRTFDNPSQNTQDRENWYGLYHADLSAKPAATQFSTACR